MTCSRMVTRSRRWSGWPLFRVGVTRLSPERQRDAERTRREILEAALAEFARNGYSGTRVDEIAARTSTTKRMIYYYFTSKEQLYIAVLERRTRPPGRRGRWTSTTLTRSPRSARWPSSPSTTMSRTRTSSASSAIENIHHGEFIAKSADHPRPQQPVVSVIGQHPGAWLRERRLPAPGGGDRHPHADQRLLLLPDVQPVHLRRDLRRRPARRVPPRRTTGPSSGT